MLASATLSFWGPLLIRLGLEVSLLAAIATFAATRIPSAAARRWIWQATLLAMLLSTTGELLGARGSLHDMRASAPRSTAEPRPLADLPPAIDPLPVSLLPGDANPHEPAPAFSLPSLWPAWLWAGFSTALLLRLALAHAWGMSRHRRRQPLPPELADHIRQLAAQLGLRHVDAAIWPGLRGPVAFGVRQPSVALPPNALQHLPAPARDAILLHELAHLAARDPLWLAFSDLVIALLAWHPAVYWIARRLRTDMEAAADTASGLIPEGRLALAETIVHYGRELSTPAWARGLGVVDSKLRSPLAHRVRALLGPPTPWTPRPRLARLTLPVALAGSALLLLPAWPGSLQPSVLELALTHVRSRAHSPNLSGKAREDLTRVERPVLTTASTSANPRPTRETDPVSVPRPASDTTSESLSPEARKHLTTGFQFLDAGLVDLALSCFERARQLAPDSVGIREAIQRANELRPRLANDHPSRTGPPALRETWARLEEIVLPRFFFADAPLSEVVPWLRRESARNDPSGEGVWIEIVARTTEPSESRPDTEILTVDDVRIRMAQPLENVTLRAALDALLPSASAAIVYEPLPHDLSVYRVILTAAIPPARSLVTRVYRVDADELLAKLFPTVPANSPELAGRAQQDLRGMLAAAGISIDPPSAVFLSHGKGLLMFRGTANDVVKLDDFLDRLALKPVRQERSVPNAFAAGPEIEASTRAAKENVTASAPTPAPAGTSPGPTESPTPTPIPAALQLETRLADIPEAAARELGLDWLLATPDSGRQPLTRGVPTGDLPGAATAHATNLNVEVHRLDPSAVVLSSTQFGALLGRLERIGGAHQSVFPQVTTTSGRSAQVSALDARTIVTAGLTGPDGIHYHSEPMEFGPTLDLHPQRHADGWSLSVTGRVSEFLGYDDPGKEKLEARLANGEVVHGQVPKPLIRVRESRATAHAASGQTLVLRLPDDVQTRRILGNWFRRDRRVTETNRSYLFITLADTAAPTDETSPRRR